MVHSYTAEYPAGSSVNPEIVKFFEDFYALSDIPGRDEQYVEMLTQDATFIIASRRAEGRHEILPARQAMWTLVESRKHSLFKVFPFSSGSNEFMIYGTVASGLRTGANVDIDWAARAELVKSASDGKWRMKFYQVYLDTGAFAAHAHSK